MKYYSLYKQIMKTLIAMATALTLSICIILGLIGCSTDTEEEAVTTEEELLPPPPPEPHWADGTVEIEVGVYKTGKGLVSALENRENIHANRLIRHHLSKKEMPMMSKVRKRVEVTVATLLEAGFTKESVTIEEVREKYKENGYRPLTIEEGIMLRLGFTDQPDMKKSDHKMVSFFGLLSKEDSEFFSDMEGIQRIFFLYRSSARDRYGEGYGLYTRNVTERKFYPHGDEEYHQDAAKTDFLGTRFACVKIK